MSLPNKIIVVVIAFGVVRICEFAQSDPYDVDIKRGYESNTEIKACGPPLIDILSSICASMINNNGKKRSNNIQANLIPDSEYPNNYEWYSDVEPSPYVFVSKRSIQSIFKKMRLKKSRPGLVDECCKKSCTIDELKGYCGSLF